MEVGNLRQRRALLLQSQGRFQLAVDEWDQALVADPGNPMALANRALCRLELDQIEAAQADADALMAAEPAWDQSHRTMAMVLSHRGRDAQALASATEAVRLEPSDADNHALVAELASSRKDWQGMLDAAMAGLMCQPDHLGCLNLRALALRQLGRTAEADATIAGALARAPSNPATHANLGWSLLNQGQPLQAEAHFLEALRLKPDYDWAREGLVASLKARSPIYRRVLAYQFWLSRMRTTYGFGVMIGSYVAYQLILSALKGTILFWPALILLASAFLLTWIADPIGNLTLLLHPRGRHALSADQRHGAILVGSLLALSLVLVVFAIVITSALLVFAAVYMLPAMMIACTVYRSARTWPRRATAAMVLVPVAMSVLMFATWTYLRLTGMDPAPWLSTVLDHVIKQGWMVNIGLLLLCQVVANSTPRR